MLPANASTDTTNPCQCEDSHACRFQVAMHAFLAAVCSDVLACVWKLCAPAGMPAMQSPDRPSHSQDLYPLTQQVRVRTSLKSSIKSIPKWIQYHVSSRNETCLCLFCTSCLPTSFEGSVNPACVHNMTGHMSEQ